MAGRRHSRPLQVRFRSNGNLVTMTYSADQEVTKVVSGTADVIENREVPTWVGVNTSGGAEPDMRVKVELREGAPRVVELAWISQPHQGEIRQKHLSQINLAKLATDLIVSTISDTDIVGDVALVPIDGALNSYQLHQQRLAAQRFMDRQRRPREYRRITPKLLEEVAKVYRDNIRGTPTKAVAETFNVERRMASEYVTRARKAGLLPETDRGRKKA
jgi:hypothetical protein